MMDQWDSEETDRAILRELDRQVTAGETPNYALATAAVRDAFNEDQSRKYREEHPWPPADWGPEKIAEIAEAERAHQEYLNQRFAVVHASAYRFLDKNAELVRACFGDDGPIQGGS